MTARHLAPMRPVRKVIAAIDGNTYADTWRGVQVYYLDLDCNHGVTIERRRGRPAPQYAVCPECTRQGGLK